MALWSELELPFAEATTDGPKLLHDIFHEAGAEAAFNVHVQPDLGFLHLDGINTCLM